MARYQRHSWNAKEYHSREEISKAIHSMGLDKKQIKEISIIGAAQNMTESNLKFTAQRELADGYTPYDEIDNANNPLWRKALVPCEAVVCEPIIITFTDGTTFELQPVKGFTVKMSTNQLNHEMKDGLNNSNFNVSEMFSEIKGAEIRDVCLTSVTYDRISARYQNYSEIRTRSLLHLSMTGTYGLMISQRYDSWFTVSLVNEMHMTDEGCEIVKKPLSQMLGYTISRPQILIVEGHDGSSYFWIMPVKHVQNRKSSQFVIEENRKEEISVEEDDVLEFLYFFLEKYFDWSYPYEACRESGFQWYLEYNIYSYKTMRKMLSEIRHMASMLKDHYDDPALDELKARYHADSFGGQGPMSKTEEAAFIKANLFVAIEFYERFCKRMTAMMDNAPDYSLISFMGP